MKLNPALLLGSVTGAMTSTPALTVLNHAAKSPVPRSAMPEPIPLRMYC